MGKLDWRDIVVRAGLNLAAGLLAAVVAGIVLFCLQAREPRLVYRAPESMPFQGEERLVAIYRVWIRNDGGVVIEDVRCALRVPDAAVEDVHVSAPLTLDHSEWVVGDTARVNIPGLNPGEEVEVSLLAAASGAPAAQRTLARRPDVSVRARGVSAVETAFAGAAAVASRWVLPTLGLAVMIGALASAATWGGRSLVRRVRLLRPGRPAFEDDFRGRLEAWKTHAKMGPVPSLCSRGLQLRPVPGRDLSTVLQLHSEPRFRDGAIECQVYLDYNALFNVIVRGSVPDDQFYMARLDSRQDFWDCVLFKPKGGSWHECNRGYLLHNSPCRRWLTMRVEADGRRISLYRDGEAVDQIRDAGLRSGTVGLFAEQGTAWVRAVRIWRW